MDYITETLLFPYRKGLIEGLKPDSRLLFLNAENPVILKELISPVLIQPRYDRARPLIDAGYKISTSAPDGKCDTVWVLPGKDMTETQYLLALAARAAEGGGIVLTAAPNDAGGKRLEKLFEDLGLSPHVESKNKARVVFASVDESWNRQQADIWFAQGQEQQILNSNILSRPGLHGWDKVDTGSALLARHLPADLSGSIADFGCGWGYLSLQATAISKKIIPASLKSPLPQGGRGRGPLHSNGKEREGTRSDIKMPSGDGRSICTLPSPHPSPALREREHSITRLTLVDIDSRAIDIARRNVQRQCPDLPIETFWTDLTQPDASLGPFDAILLNPPFHDGTYALPALGQAIIATAAQSLKQGGRLYLVANRHLPYEKTLHMLFNQIDVLCDENGFKAFVCVKK